MAILDSQAEDKAAAGGWSWKADLTDDAGLVLREVSHAGYSFALDLRLVKIWVSNGTPQTPGAITRNYLLGSPDLPATPQTIMKRESPLVTLIRPYTPSVELAAAFETKSGVLGGQGDPLGIEQSYVFTEYSRTPIHEPGAVLKAARCYPLTRFSYTGSQQGPPTLAFIRFDYRCDISIDASIDASLQERTKGKMGLVDQAGVFSDTEAQIIPRLSAIFARAEKPVVRELIGQGLQRGTMSDWDNIHQWGSQQPLPATPGAFHAAHNHWRWGASAATGQSLLSLPPRPPLQGAPFFGGLGGPGGPLLDPRIPHQSIRFAITGRGTDQAPAIPQWDPSNHPSSPNFDDLFTTARDPASIGSGAVLTQWLSFEVERDPDAIEQNAPWEGAVFIHGYFFSHEHEDLGFGQQSVAGLKDALTKEEGAVQEKGWVRK